MYAVDIAAAAAAAVGATAEHSFFAGCFFLSLSLHFLIVIVTQFFLFEFSYFLVTCSACS